MTTWTTIPDASLDPNAPARSIDAKALRDNPVAIAEGAAGAPLIGGGMNSVNVGKEIGAVIVAHYRVNNASTTYPIGTIAAAASLFASAGGAFEIGTSTGGTLSLSLSGQWQALTPFLNDLSAGVYRYRPALWVRIS